MTKYPGQPDGEAIQTAPHDLVAGQFLQGLGRWGFESIELIGQGLPDDSYGVAFKMSLSLN